MRAAVFSDAGGPEAVEIRDVAEPTPGPGEAVVRVEACALNHHDLWILEEGFEGDGPFVPGVDVAGVVDAVGDDVERVAPGDRVVLCPNETCGSCRYCREGPENTCAEYGIYHGGLAERALVNADRLLHLPASVSTTAAAALPVSYMTAWRMLQRADAGLGDRVFVPGATGGVGVAAVQLVDAIGGRSIGTSRSGEKLARLEEVGLDHAIESDDVDEIRTAVEELGEVDVVLNHLGGEFVGLGMDVLRRTGTMVVCGRTAGSTASLDVSDLFWNHKRLVGSTMGTQGDLATLVEMAANGLEPVVGAEYPLADTARAFADMHDRSAFGKLVVHP